MNALAVELLRRAPVVALVSLRVGLVMALLPAPFGETSPVRVRAALGFLISLVLCLAFFPRFPDVALDTASLVEATVTELLMGAVIGLTVRVTLAAAELAGSVVGTSVGLGFAASIDPTFGDEGVPTTMLFNGLSTLTFFALGGHHVVFQALLASMETARPGLALQTLHAAEIVGLGGQMVAHGLRIASPVVATMFIVQVGTALVARAAPRVQIFALTFGVSISVGALVLVASAPQVARSMAVNVSSILPSIIDVLRGSTP